MSINILYACVVFMSVCMCLCVYVCMYVLCLYVCLYMYVCMGGWVWIISDRVSPYIDGHSI